MIQEITDNLVTVNDTISLAVKDLILANKRSSSNSAITDVWEVFGPILTAILGGAFALWYKSNEIKNMEENLNLQKQIFDQTKINQENQLKSELVRLQDLSNQYKLSLKKFDFEKVSKILDLSNDKEFKIQMIKSFHDVLEKLNIENSIVEPDAEGHREFVIRNVFGNLDNIVQEIKQIHKQFPNVYIEIQENLLSIAQTAENINYEAADLLSLQNMDEETVHNYFGNYLVQIHVDLNGVYKRMINDFKIVELLKKGLISTDNNQTKNDSKTT